MNSLHLELGQLSIIINVAIRIITAFIFLAFIIPLQIKEANVKNGLKKLRHELLTAGIIIFSVNTFGLIIIVFNYLKVDTHRITDIVTYFNTFGFLVYACVKLRIYTQSYTPEQKKLHEQFDKIEAAVERQAQKEKTEQ